jgi:hypothetical protein
MSEQELLQHYERLVEMYGDQLPNPEHEPVRFAYFVKLYKYYSLKPAE